jgi:CDP-glucose 4,6-dehydratase
LKGGIVPKSLSRKGFLNYFKNSRVLVTGNTGFKGCWLSLFLHSQGAEVLGLSLDVPTIPAFFDTIPEELGLKTVWRDINDTEYVVSLLEDFRPNYIFHLSAQAIVSKSFANPLEAWRTNTLGTASMLEALCRSSLTDVNVVMITSDKVYRNHEWPWGYRESDELGGSDPYSASKAGAELAIRSYVNSGFFDGRNTRIAAVRAGNVIGGGDWADGRIVPDAVRAWSGNKHLVLRNPSATRPWQHVLEPLGGYLLTAAALDQDAIRSGETFNFGPSEQASRTVAELVSALGSRLGGQDPLQVKYEKSDLAESGLLRLSSEKAQHLLSWQPVLGFDQTIEWTADWYSKQANGADNLDLALDQIKSYQELLNETPNWGQF